MSASTCPEPDRGQLIHVAHQQQARMRRNGLGERIHQRHIDHRGLVHHQQIAVERVLLVAREAAVLRVDLQQAVDGLGLDPGLLGHALGRTSCRSRQRHPDALGHQEAQDRVEAAWSCRHRDHPSPPTPWRRAPASEPRAARPPGSCPCGSRPRAMALSRSISGQGGWARCPLDQP